MCCLDVKVELQAYVDGELSPERVARLEHHLASCDRCRAEVTRLQAVVTALETWPLVVEPADLTTHVMTQVKPCPVLPAFRLRWSDFAISLAAAGLAFVAMLAWRYLTSTSLAYHYYTLMALELKMLRLEGLLAMHRLARAGAPIWGVLSLAGITLIIVLPLAFTMSVRKASPVWESDL